MRFKMNTIILIMLAALTLIADVARSHYLNEDIDTLIIVLAVFVAAAIVSDAISKVDKRTRKHQKQVDKKIDELHK
jgi:hypothetical protein